MRLTSKSEYGLLAMIDIAAADESRPVSVREISDRRTIPRKFLEQIFHALRQAGLVDSRRGPHGGFTLSRSAADITVLEIVEAVEGPLRASVCVAAGSEHEGPVCGQHGSCAAASVWSRATEAMRREFDSVSLASLGTEQRDFDVARLAG